jgi:hypothetical protein
MGHGTKNVEKLQGSRTGDRITTLTNTQKKKKAEDRVKKKKEKTKSFLCNGLMDDRVFPPKSFSLLVLMTIIRSFRR